MEGTQETLPAVRLLGEPGGNQSLEQAKLCLTELPQPQPLLLSA